MNMVSSLSRGIFSWILMEFILDITLTVYQRSGRNIKSLPIKFADITKIGEKINKEEERLMILSSLD